MLDEALREDEIAAFYDMKSDALRASAINL
jgi:hypothetical protein